MKIIDANKSSYDIFGTHMESDTLYIEGSDLSPMVKLFREGVDDIHLISYGNVYVFTLEKYYFRIKSNLLTVVIFNFKDKGRIDVRIISGGGGEGLMGISWGAESSSNNTIIGILKELCESRGWRLCDMQDGEVTEYADPEEQKRIEKGVEEYEEMMVKYNGLLNLDRERDAEKLYDDWCKQHPDEEA